MKIERAEKEKITMIVTTRDEALEIIQSLSSQLLNGNSSSGRAEHYTADREYVSIAVEFNS